MYPEWLFSMDDIVTWGVYTASSDLETLEMSGNFDTRRKSGKSQGILKKKKQEKSGNFVV